MATSTVAYKTTIASKLIFVPNRCGMLYDGLYPHSLERGYRPVLSPSVQYRTGSDGKLGKFCQSLMTGQITWILWWSSSDDFYCWIIVIYSVQLYQANFCSSWMLLQPVWCLIPRTSYGTHKHCARSHWGFGCEATVILILQIYTKQFCVQNTIVQSSRHEAVDLE